MNAVIVVYGDMLWCYTCTTHLFPNASVCRTKRKSGRHGRRRQRSVSHVTAMVTCSPPSVFLPPHSALHATRASLQKKPSAAPVSNMHYSYTKTWWLISLLQSLSYTAPSQKRSPLILSLHNIYCFIHTYCCILNQSRVVQRMLQVKKVEQAKEHEKVKREREEWVRDKLKKLEIKSLGLPPQKKCNRYIWFWWVVTFILFPLFKKVVDIDKVDFAYVKRVASSMTRLKKIFLQCVFVQSLRKWLSQLQTSWPFFRVYYWFQRHYQNKNNNSFGRF